MQILNPIANNLFQPLALTLSALLFTGFAAVVAARVFVKDPDLKRQLLLRWLSWALIAAVTLFSVLSGTLLFAILVSLISFACSFEYCRITARKNDEKLLILSASLLLPQLSAHCQVLLAPLALFFAFLIALLSLKRAESFESTAVSLLALPYIAVFVSYAVLLHKNFAQGPALVLSVVSASALANIAAFVFGKILGGAKLALRVSPNKTWWGVLGAFLGAFCGFRLLSISADLHLPLLLWWMMPLAVAIAGVVGDLFESLLKRSFQVKDAGSWLPGFGGALDRVDGLLFVIPTVYYLVLAFF
ncbi:MAG: phosphatidate cytidylyltransferase [Candidatus Obscuribacterales bacterium]|nr:phosphatidate cytidylyltransferase [Candidatus Obscuribacterales bacterium]